jgi:hypothetical protein
MKPKRIEYEVGKDEYGRTVTLIRELQSSGKYKNVLARPAANQRDEDAFFHDLTDEMLINIGSLMNDRR